MYQYSVIHSKMGHQSYILPYTTDEEREYLLKKIEEHNHYYENHPYPDDPQADFAVGEDLDAVCSFPLLANKPKIMGDNTRAILCGNGGGRNSTTKFFRNNNIQYWFYTKQKWISTNQKKMVIYAIKPLPKPDAPALTQPKKVIKVKSTVVSIDNGTETTTYDGETTVKYRMRINPVNTLWECGRMKMSVGGGRMGWVLRLPLFRMGCPGDEHALINLPECSQPLSPEMTYDWFVSLGELLNSEPFCYFDFSWFQFRKNCLEPNKNYFKQEFGWDDHKVDKFLEDGMVFITSRTEYEEGEKEYLEMEGTKLPTLKNFWDAERVGNGYGLEY